VHRGKLRRKPGCENRKGGIKKPAGRKSQKKQAKTKGKMGGLGEKGCGFKKTKTGERELQKKKIKAQKRAGKHHEKRHELRVQLPITEKKLPTKGKQKTKT